MPLSLLNDETLNAKETDVDNVFLNCLLMFKLVNEVFIGHVLLYNKFILSTFFTTF